MGTPRRGRHTRAGGDNAPGRQEAVDDVLGGVLEDADEALDVPAGAGDGESDDEVDAAVSVFVPPSLELEPEPLEPVPLFADARESVL